MSYDLSQSKRLAAFDVPEFVSRAKDLAGSSAQLKRRMLREIDGLGRSIEDAPQQKEALKQRLTDLAMQLSKLSDIITKARLEGRADLEHAAKQRRETMMAEHGAAQMDLGGFDAHHASCRQLLQAIERQLYALGLAVEREMKLRESGLEPEPRASGVMERTPDGNDPPQPETTLMDGATEHSGDGAITADEPTPEITVSAETTTAVEPTPDAVLKDPSAGTATAAEPSASASVPTMAPEPADSSDLDAEFAALMSAMGEDSAQEPVVHHDQPDGADDLADIMAGLELEEVDEHALPPGAEEELAREDAEIAAQAKKTGIKVPVIDSAAKPETSAPKGDVAVTTKQQPPSPADKGSQPRRGGRVWLWLIALAIVGAGGYAAYAYLLAPG